MNRKIKGFENYKIDKDGEIYSLLSKKYLSPSIAKCGYKIVVLSNKKQRKTMYVHRLVAENFIGEISSKHVNHKDYNRLNNNINNLEIVTQKENNQHAYKKHGNNYGILKYNLLKKRHRKITEKQIVEIKNSSLKKRELASKYNVDIRTIFYIRSK